jgi:predicted  nucleic acid-binding Zn-ribbon protein
MDEARFVVKCLIFASLLIALTQLKTKSGTIETDIEATLLNSQTASLVNTIADGGVKAIRDFNAYLKSKITATVREVPTQDQLEANVKEVEQKVQAKAVDTRKAIEEIKAKVQSTTSEVDSEVEEIE